MAKLGRFLKRQEKGITLLELVVVLSILAVVASIVTPAVGGQTTRGRGSTKLSDISAVQSAVDNFSSEAPANSDLSQAWPVNGKHKPSASEYHAKIVNFKLPDGSTTTLYVKPLDFNASFTASSESGTTTKTLVPSYVRAFPKHAGNTSGSDPNVTVDTSGKNAADPQATVFTGFTAGTGNGLVLDGKNFTPTTGDGTTALVDASATVNVWVMDQDGRVWVLLDDGYY